MTRLYDTPLVRLLPDSIAADPTIHATAASLDGMLLRIVQSVPNVLLYARLLLTAGRTSPFPLLPALQRIIDASGGLKALSTPELELLAWQFHVDFREVARTDTQLAEMIVQSIPWHRIKGTPASIINALALFNYHAEIEEDGTGQHWATYQLGLPQIADIPTVQKILSIAREMQPARCRLWRMYTDVFDKRPIVLSVGPALGDGWLSYYSGVPVDGGDTPDNNDVIVSFGVKNAYQAEIYAPRDLLGSFGATTHLGFIAPYLDTFRVGRSRLSDVYPRNNPFVIGSLFSILWADRATTGRRWRGFWDARSWLDYTGFDRKLPLWRMEKRAASRAQLVPSWSEEIANHNSKLGAAFAVTIDAPARLGELRLSAHDHQRQEARLHEFHIATRGASTEVVTPPAPSCHVDSWHDHVTRTLPLHNEHWRGTWKGHGMWRPYIAYTHITHEYKEY